MPAEWTIEHWPPCTRYVFLSHCQEDRARLVVPVQQALQDYGCHNFLDKHHYPTGRDAFEVLRGKILECRHVVYFITSHFLTQGRGWTGIERAYSMVAQQSLRYGTNEVCHVELPLFFVPKMHSPLARSAWGGMGGGVGRGRFYKPGRVDKGAVDWATHEILNFVRQEAQYALEIADRVERDTRMNNWLKQDPHLRARVLGQSLPPLPLRPRTVL